VQAWNDFQARLPAGEQANWSRDPPALLAVNAAVQQWTKDFEDKDKEDYESAKINFAIVCQTLDSYFGLFQFFPSGDKYFSAMCGTVALIVKVSQTRNRLVLITNRSLTLRTLWSGIHQPWQDLQRIRVRVSEDRQGNYVLA